MQLTDKQIRFCEEYIIDMNGTQAAIRAGYSEKTARQIASEYLSKPNIQEKISLLKKELSEKTGVTAQMVINELAKVAFLDPRDLFSVDNALLNVRQLDDKSAGAISSIEVYEEYGVVDDERQPIGQTKKIKFWDKVSALEKLGKHLGIFEKDNTQRSDRILVKVKR